jgi:hypothetical protein
MPPAEIASSPLTSSFPANFLHGRLITTTELDRPASAYQLSVSASMSWLRRHNQNDAAG